MKLIEQKFAKITHNFNKDFVPKIQKYIYVYLSL